MIDNEHLNPDEVPVPEPQPENVRQPRNQHLKVENPKNIQFTGRATAAEAAIINKALAIRKKQLGIDENGKYDIVRLALDAIEHIKGDIFSSFKVA